MPNPGTFLGLRKQFVEAQSTAYAAAVESGQVNDVLCDIQRRYFKRFPPGLEHNVEPTQEWLNLVDDSAPDQDIPVPNPDLPLDEFRQESLRYDKLKEEIKTRKEQIKRRLHYIYTRSRGERRETAFEKNSTNALSVLAAKLSGVSVTKPRKKTPANLWGPQNRALVDPIFNDRVEKGNVPVSQHLKLRSSIYKEMFDALPMDEQKRWHERADEEHNTQLKAQEDTMKAPPSTAPADRQRVITAIPKLVEPILDLIAEYTGWKGSLIMGGPEPGDNGRLNMVSIHFGVTQGTVKMDFGRSERAVFKNHIQPAFGRFMKKCFTIEDCRAMALPADHQEVMLSTVAAEEDIHVHRFDHELHSKVHPPPARSQALAKTKENTAPGENSASGSQPRLPVTQKSGEQVKYGPPNRDARKAKVSRVAPVGVAKDKILEPLPKAPADHAPPAEPSRVVPTSQIATNSQIADAAIPPTAQQSNQEISDISRGLTMPKPALSPRSPAPTPPPSRPPSPIPSAPELHQPAQPTVESVEGTSGTSKSERNGAVDVSTSTVIGSIATALGAGEKDAASGLSQGLDVTPPVQSSAAATLSSSKTAGSSTHSPGAATVPDNDALHPTAVTVPDNDVLHPTAAATSSSSTTAGSSSHSPGAVTVPDNGAPDPTAATVPDNNTLDPTAAATSSSSKTAGLSTHSPGAATVPDNDTLDAMVTAKAKKRKASGRKGSKGVDAAGGGTKRKADNAAADAPNKRGRMDVTPAFSVNLPNNVPDWASSVIDIFTSTALGARWEALVVEWVEFEDARGFVKDAGSLSSVGRPPFVSAWIKRARKSAPREGIGAPEVFETNFVSWWRSLQPKERLNGEDGLLARGDINWECLGVSGQNGLLSVVGALFYWGVAVVGHATRQQHWALALEDVEYALQQLNSVE